MRDRQDQTGSQTERSRDRDKEERDRKEDRLTYQNTNRYHADQKRSTTSGVCRIVFHENLIRQEKERQQFIKHF